MGSVHSSGRASGSVVRSRTRSRYRTRNFSIRGTGSFPVEPRRPRAISKTRPVVAYVNSFVGVSLASASPGTLRPSQSSARWIDALRDALRSRVGDEPMVRLLVKQLEMSGQMELVDQPYHRAILQDEIPLSIGGGIGQSRVYMLLLRKAHLGEVGVTVWPDELKKICAERNIHVLS